MSLQKNLWTVSLRISLTHLATLEHLVTILGGRIHDKWILKGRRPAWVWSLNDRDELAQVLSAIRPWMVTKAEEADVLLEFLTTPRQRGRKFTAIERAEREKVYWKLRELKKENKMPAKSKAQLRWAYAACNRGEKAGCEMAEKTKSAKNLPERKKSKAKSK